MSASRMLRAPEMSLIALAPRLLGVASAAVRRVFAVSLSTAVSFDAIDQHALTVRLEPAEGFPTPQALSACPSPTLCVGDGTAPALSRKSSGHQLLVSLVVELPRLA